jgi:hypothetical protein
MAQLFPRSTNAFARASILAAGALGALALGLVLAAPRSPWATQQGVVRDQPVPFSHLHHVGGMGIDCRYCHTSVERSAAAGIPPTKTCMNCHLQVWSDSPTLAPVRESLRTGKPLRWAKVYDLPDFVYFNHSAHVNKGVGCDTCHGRVDRMPLLYQHSSLLMEWCLECHRAPEKYVRPKDQVANPAWEPPANQIEEGRRLVKAYGINPRTSCSTCHR